MNLLNELAKQITRMEGFSPGTVAWRNNNPGNLRDGPRATEQDAKGYAVYGDVIAGYQDLFDLIRSVVRKHPDITLVTFFAGQRDAAGQLLPGGYPGYAPAADSNQPTAYARFVADGLGISAAEPLAKFITA